MDFDTAGNLISYPASATLPLPGIVNWPIVTTGTNVATGPLTLRVYQPKPEGEKRDLRGKQTRDFEITDLKVVREKGDDGPALYEVAVSSESEIERYFGIEILDHGKGAVDMSRMKRGAAVLVDHGGDQVGVVEDFRVDPDHVSRAHVRFSESVRGQEVERDVATKVRRNISVGYFIQRYKKVEDRVVGQDEQGRDITIPVYRVTRWQPAEVSLVSVPADITVGVGRDAGDDGPILEVEASHRDGRAVREEPQMDEKEKEAAAAAASAAATAVEQKRADDIMALCKAAKRDHLASDFIGSTLSVAAVAQRIEAAVKTEGVGQPHSDPLAAAPAKDRKRYSYARAILMQADAIEGRAKQEGVEWEIHKELVTQMASPSFRHKGLLIPTDLRSPDERWQQYAKRSLDSKTATKGVEVVFEQQGEFIELLRNNAVVASLGARIMGGLTGPIAFPKQIGGMTVFWVGENPANPVTASDPTLGQVQMAPKTLQGTTSYSRQFLAQASIDVEAWVRNELAIAHALEIDRTAYHGEGAAGEPVGIYNAADVQSQAFGGAPTAALINQMPVKAAQANALQGSLAFVVTPKAAGTMKQTPIFAGATGGPVLWDGTVLAGTLVGYPAVATTQLSITMSGSADTGGTEQGLIFGNWSELIIGMWAAMDAIVDPYSLATSGMIRVTSFGMSDLAIRHGQSFCKATGNTG